MHVRQQIRDAVAAALRNLATTGNRVYVGRTRPLAEGHEPTLLIYTTQEESSRGVMGNPPTLERVLTLHIEGRVSEDSVPDDLLDDIATEVETAMWNTTALDQMIYHIQFRRSEIQIEAQGTAHIGGIRLEYLVKYRTKEGAPGLVV